MRRATAERALRVLERLTAGVSVAQVALAEALTARRIRQIVAETPARRAVEPPAGFVPLQIGRLSDAMRIAHAKMMESDLQAMDRVIRFVGEFDRYHGFGRAEIVAQRALTAAAKQNARQTIEKTESGETGDCAEASQ